MSVDLSKTRYLKRPFTDLEADESQIGPLVDPFDVTSWTGHADVCFISRYQNYQSMLEQNYNLHSWLDSWEHLVDL